MSTMSSPPPLIPPTFAPAARADPNIPFVSSKFDSGNGTLVSASREHVVVRIENDAYSYLEKKHFKQWFHFRVSGTKTGAPIRFSIANAGDCVFSEGFEGYNTCASYDRKHWFRVPSTFVDGVLSWEMQCAHNQIYFAYFAPYSHERHLDLIARCVTSPVVSIVRSLGHTVDGRDIDLVTVGSGPLKIWITARQHPGESMAEWFVEGLLDRLLDTNDALSRRLRSEATFYIVPNMNPDGSFRGYLRVNAAGCNLNREWADSGKDYEAPTLERSPEVYYIMQESARTGCDFFIDAHGDECIPHNFVTSMEANPKWNARLEGLQREFKDYWTKINPDFQNKEGYEADPPMKANLRLAAAQMCFRFECPSFTLEMPFKDANDAPVPEVGWSAERSQRLGHSVLDTLAHMFPLLDKK